MPNPIRQEIKSAIKYEIRSRGLVTWSEVVSKVAEDMDLHPMYVEKQMGDLISRGEIQRHDTRGFPKYSLAAEGGAQPGGASPGAAEGKYGDFTTRRLDMENPTKSGTYEDDPRKQGITDRKAV